MMLCECGQEAKYQLKNGNWCCSKSKNSCPVKKNSQKTKMTGKKLNLTKEKIPWNKGKINVYSKETLDLMSNVKKGSIPWNKGKINVYSKETLDLMSNVKKGKACHENVKKGLSNFSKTRFSKKEKRLEQSKKLKEFFQNHPEIKKLRREEMLNGKAKYINSFPKKGYKNHVDYMINGGALKMIKAIKKISNEEIKLRNLVKELYPDCEFQHKVFNYSLDIALIKEKIAIEYDGYYHFDTEEHIQYHKQRQEKIESEGWKFYRVTMFDKFPSLEEINEEIHAILENKI